MIVSKFCNHNCNLMIENFDSILFLFWLLLSTRLTYKKNIRLSFVFKYIVSWFQWFYNWNWFHLHSYTLISCFELSTLCLSLSLYYGIVNHDHWQLISHCWPICINSFLIAINLIKKYNWKDQNQTQIVLKSFFRTLLY